VIVVTEVFVATEAAFVGVLRPEGQGVAVKGLITLDTTYEHERGQVTA